jgi:serine/threonine protein kinase
MIGMQIGSYQILEKLGEGGMGVVYRAVDTNLDRPVAVKVLNTDVSKNPDLVQRFRAEAKAQANRNATDRIAFIHDETPHKGVLRDTFEGLKNDIGIKNRDRLASIECKGWKDEILLQAADLIAYENFKVIERKQVGAEMRIPMKRILLSSKFAGRNALVTKAALQEFRDKADRPTLDLVLKYARIKPA